MRRSARGTRACFEFLLPEAPGLHSGLNLIWSTVAEPRMNSNHRNRGSIVQITMATTRSFSALGSLAGLLLLGIVLLHGQGVESWISTFSLRSYGPHGGTLSRLLLSASAFPSHEADSQQQPSSTDNAVVPAKPTGDTVRASSGVRPSLHPITINILTQLLKKRYADTTHGDSGEANDTTDTTNSTTATNTPLQYALEASALASSALAQRTTHDDNDQNLQLTLDEQQTIAGRVVNMAVRLQALEKALYRKCQKQATRLNRYHEWASFGVLPDEPNPMGVRQQLADNPLFGLNRAECLLALFLTTIEAPELRLKNATVPGGSVVDFIDQDRMEVLLA